VIDFHCHLDLYKEPHTVAAECGRRGLYVLSVTTTPSAWCGTKALAGTNDRIRTAIGLHPQIAHERYTELSLFDAIVRQTRYVGEVGLDGSPELRPYWDMQVRVFNHILAQSASAGGRIISIHSRRAAKAVLDCLEKVPGAGVAVLHWFSGSVRELERAISLGCWFSIGPAMLISERGRILAARMPRDRVLTESDGPFAQVAGASAMPWQAGDAATELARIWGVSEISAREAIKSNFRVLVSAH
jgi:TatD DNase family protein